MSQNVTILEKCLLLDLETTPEGRILKMGMVCGSEEHILQGRFRLADAEQVLDRLARQADFVLGHNILEHDLPHLRRLLPRLLLHRHPCIDTLYLSPLAFPENPYHHLVKDYRLLHTALNDPVSDARNAGQLFLDELAVFDRLREDAMALLRFYAWGLPAVMGHLFRNLGITPLNDSQAAEFFGEFAGRYGCCHGAREVASELCDPACRPAAPYVAAWLRVAGANSILPHWVRHRFPKAKHCIRRIREIICDDPACPYCPENHDPGAQLARFFGFKDFRADPRTSSGESLQERIVRQGMSSTPLLAILPTGGGKSLCYQLPALVRHVRKGALTVIISPLQALMKDQVENLNRLTGSTFAAALYGMLTPPERGDVLERVQRGDVAILYVSPEQLRNVSFRQTIREREIGCWVFDEAHCLSRWGHSFRPDYLYASRFIRELAQSQSVACPPVACFTATAKRDVTAEILAHFRQELDQELILLDAGSERSNLDFEVQWVSAPEKFERVRELLQAQLPVIESGASVVYCATRKQAAALADWLQQHGLPAAAFHAGLDAPEKRRVQEAFMRGEIQHICATNAFGMGIDKDNVRLVIHADIPGSLESYLQEAGRAGRDRQAARCILLYDQQDIETQFALSAASRLSRHDIAQILRGLRRARRGQNNEIVITAGEILRDQEVDVDIDMCDPMAPTKIGVAVATLERAGFIQRNENRTRALQLRPLVRTLAEARERIEARDDLSRRTKQQWMDMLAHLYNEEPASISVDMLAELPSMARSREEGSAGTPLQHDTLHVVRILNDMVQAGILEKDTMLSAYLKVRCAHSADKQFAKIRAIEISLIKRLQEEEPDPQGWMTLSLRRLNQCLLDEGYACAPETLRNLLASLALDGQGLAGQRGSLEIQYRNQDCYAVKIKRPWDALIETATKRHAVANVLLDALIRKTGSTTGGEHLVKFGEKEMLDALHGDMFLAPQIRDFHAAFERGLLYLHEQKIIMLQQGLAVFRQAMTITVLPDSKGRRFAAGDYSSLNEHYRERTFQVHVMNKYAMLGLGKIKQAMALVAGYFTMSKTGFVRAFFHGEETMLERATSAESYRMIVDQLNNGVQTAIVSEAPEKNMLVLAGPGSGKTRVVAHRCAYLLRVVRARPREILVVCFNRAAATSLRKRIRGLVGRDATGVTIQTYHALAMRLAGASFTGRFDKRKEPPDLAALIPAASRILRGECDLPGIEADEVRERVLAGYRYILIDEYQDIDQDQYDLISAIAGRTLTSRDADATLSILAVGDDDQNIYSFRGANIQFIRQFEEDYQADTHYLVENYRSTASILAAANRLIAHNTDRMKTRHPVVVNASRRSEAAGSAVDICMCKNTCHQARFILDQTIESLARNESIAVFTRTNEELHPVRAALEAGNIPVFIAAEKHAVPLFLLRESVALISLLKQHRHETMNAKTILAGFRQACFCPEQNPWSRLLESILREWEEETNNRPRKTDETLEYLYEALHEYQREPAPPGMVYLSTVHAAKGLEFDRVILSSNWHRQHDPKRHEEERRLFYVGMTRARKKLMMCALENRPHPFLREIAGEHVRRLRAAAPDEPADHDLKHHYTLLGPSSVWLNYPAVATNGSHMRRAIAELQPGTPIRLKLQGRRIFMLTCSNEPVGALSAAAHEQWGERLHQILHARVHAMIVWRKEYENDPPERMPDQWEVPLLEISHHPSA